MDAVGFAASVIGTVALVSNAVTTFAGLCNVVSEVSKEDVDIRVKALLFELQSTSRKIADWRQAWIPEKVDSDAYFMLLWGHTGRREIDDSLENIRAKATSIIERSSSLKDSLHQDPEKGRPYDIGDWLDWTRTLDSAGSNHGISVREEIRSSVGELVRRVLELRDSTDLHFRSMHAPNRDAGQRPARLEEALASRSVSIAAYEICGRQAEVADLELNLLDNETDVDKVADVFDWSDLPPVYHLTMDDNIDPTLTRSIALEILDDQEPTEGDCPVISEPSRKLVSKREWQCEFCEHTVNGKTNVIRHQSQIYKKQSHTRDRLLPYFARPPPNDGKRVKKSLTQAQKKGLGFRVAECALFLLGTPWLAGLTHSTIHDLGTFDKDGQFFIRVPLQSSELMNSAHQLSEAHQIRQIGILLVETALETVWTEQNEPEALSEEVMQQLKTRMGLSYQEACKFCFSVSTDDTQQVSQVPSAGQLLSSFYLHVYLSLRDSYNDLRGNTVSQSARKKKGLLQLLKW